MTIHDVEQIKQQLEQTIVEGDTIDALLNKFVNMCEQQSGNEWDMLLVEVSGGSGMSALFDQLLPFVTSEMKERYNEMMSTMTDKVLKYYNGSEKDMTISFVRQFEVEDNEDEPVQICMELQYECDKQYSLSPNWENNTVEGRKAFFDKVVKSRAYKWALKNPYKSVSVELNLC